MRNLFGLAPGGVYQAVTVTRYTGELLPFQAHALCRESAEGGHLFTLSNRSLRSRVGGFPFCGTFLPVAGTPRYGAPCPVELGLSSPLVSKYLGATTCSA